MGHQAIAVYLHEQHKLPAWWSQEVTVGYERIRGLREEHQTPRGYQVSVSKTLPVATEKLYEAWTVEEIRRRWLGGDAPTSAPRVPTNRSASPGSMARRTSTWPSIRKAH